MSYRYKSPFFPYAVTKVSFFLVMMLFVSLIIDFLQYQRFWLAALFFFPSIVFAVLFLRTKRIAVDASGVQAGSWIFKRLYAFASIRSALQIPLMTPKTVYISLKPFRPLAFVWCPVTFRVWIDDLLNQDIHESVEYIVSRARSAKN
jgi:hypothetical protein